MPDRPPPPPSSSYSTHCPLWCTSFCRTEELNSTQAKAASSDRPRAGQDRTGQWSKRTLKQWSLDRIKSEEQPQKGGWTSEATSFVRQPLSTAFPIHIPWFFISSQLRPKPPSHSPDRPPPPPPAPYQSGRLFLTHDPEMNNTPKTLFSFP